MTTSNKNNHPKGKTEPDFEEKEPNLAYDKEESTYELDVDDADPDYDHPSDYDTIAEGAVDDDSTYDDSNPYVGDEYADLDEIENEELEGDGMHITSSSDLKTSALDEELSMNDEDLRDDLDEEGYPKNE